MKSSSLLVLGLMSGTSADGIEAALVRISGAPPKLKSKLLGHASLPIPRPIRSAILRVAEGTPVPAAEISEPGTVALMSVAVTLVVTKVVCVAPAVQRT